MIVKKYNEEIKNNYNMEQKQKDLSKINENLQAEINQLKTDIENLKIKN